MFDQIIDANVNRIGEGLRVIEEYVRFVRSDTNLTNQLAIIRKRVHQAFPQHSNYLHSRSTATDTRAKEIPKPRASVYDLLVANFKRVQEAFRVLEEYAANQDCNQCRYDMYDLEQRILLLAKKPSIKRGVYLISDSVDVIKQGIDWGCSLVQLRDKFATKSELLDRAYVVAEYAALHDVPFIMNDFLDIAQLVDADGLHTGQDDIPVSLQRKILGEHKLLGRTTHSLEQGKIAKEQGVDYVSVGPIWETPSKPGRDGIGFDYLAVVKDTLDIPFVAIGGINNDNFDQVMEYKPHMVGVIRSFESVPHWQQQF